jgi:hypothetical protein
MQAHTGSTAFQYLMYHLQGFGVLNEAGVVCDLFDPRQVKRNTLLAQQWALLAPDHASMCVCCAMASWLLCSKMHVT